jgi:hypothetical protein
MKRDYNQSFLDVAKILPMISLLQYPQCIHEIHHNQLTPLAKIEFLKAKELLTILQQQTRSKDTNHYSQPIVHYFILSFHHEGSLLLYIEEEKGEEVRIPLDQEYG